MSYWCEDHPILTGIIGTILVIILIVGGIILFQHARNIIFNGNEQIIDTNWRYTWAVVELGNGELIEGPITSWKDFNESDMIQFTMDNKTYLTHSSNVILCTEKP